MTHSLSAQPTSRPWTSRIPSGVMTAGRFVLHFAEMWIVMLVGMVIFMAIPGVMTLPAVLHQLGMAISMTMPMVAWMRVRGHGWRHGVEMAAGMLLPWAAVLGLVALGAATALPWLSSAGDAAMVLGMLGVMLARREHYAHGAVHRHTALGAERAHAPRIPWRRVLLAIAYVSAVVLLPSTVGTANFWYKSLGPGNHSDPLQAPTYSGALPALPTPDPSKKIAVVVSGADGSEIGDTMEAYEILARSGVFNVYSVAQQRRALALQPGFGFGASSLDFVPHFSFAEYDAQVGRPPDVIAIPWFTPTYTPEHDAAALEWIRTHFGANTTILGICSGNMILADTGLVAGRTATSNTGTFGYVESHSPTTRWLHNLRYVDDGSIVTSSNLTAGIDATLHVVDKIAGRATALDVARQIGYTQTGALDDPHFAAPENVIPQIALTAGWESPREQQLGVLLYDGVTELGLSGLIDPQVATFSARPFVMAPERRIVQSRNGFQFVPRYDFSTMPALDRVLVPAGENSLARQQTMAAWHAVQPQRAAEDIYQNVGASETVYDVTLRDLARTHGASLARAVADGLFYTTDSQFPEAGWPVAGLLSALGIGLLGAAAVYGATHRRTSRQTRATVARG